jgi:DNA-binding SARP family transcriptional activator
MTIEFHLLGPVEAWVNGRRVDLGSSRQRCVLAAVLIDVNHVVPTGQLQGRVWGENPPPTARETLHSYLSRLRKALAGADDFGLTWESGGYVATVDATTVDVHRFRRLITGARVTEDEHALALFDEALCRVRAQEINDRSFSGHC